MNLFANRYRGLATVAVLLAVATAVFVGAGLAAGWMSFGPPNPETAHREAILRWLVLSDVATQPREFQASLVARFERELQAGPEISESTELSIAHQVNLAQNIATLKRVWFVDAVGQYSELASEQQTKFLDARVATVLAWSELEQSFNGDNPDDASIGSFCDQIQQWVRGETDSDLRLQMEQAVQDGVVRWLAIHSLDEQPMPLRIELAMRIAEQLDAGLNIGSLKATAGSEVTQLRGNCELLMEAWLRKQADLYSELPTARQPAFIGQRIDNVNDWGLLQLFADEESEKPEQQGAMKLMALTQTWIERTPESQRAKLRRLLAAVQSQMLLRMLNRG